VVVEREAIALEIDSILSEIGDKWGVSIEGVLIKCVHFRRRLAPGIHQLRYSILQGHHLLPGGLCLVVFCCSAETYW
jgi:hypothetical protein